MSRYKQFSPKRLVAAVCHRHHFSSPNTTEIIFTLLFLGVIGRVLSFLSRDAKY